MRMNALSHLEMTYFQIKNENYLKTLKGMWYKIDARFDQKGKINFSQRVG